uniref:Uncharacterized protein n=1 Tax=Romanomermis culicivorax TaxID=13658 RepID=A0A915J990_ROMCU
MIGIHLFCEKQQNAFEHFVSIDRSDGHIKEQTVQNRPRNINQRFGRSLFLGTVRGQLWFNFLCLRFTPLKPHVPVIDITITATGKAKSAKSSRLARVKKGLQG